MWDWSCSASGERRMAQWPVIEQIRQVNLDHEAQFRSALDADGCVLDMGGGDSGEGISRWGP